MRLVRIFWTAALAAGLALGQQTGGGLFDAIRKDDLGALKSLISAGAAVDARGPHGVTPLMLASAFGSPEAMRILIDAGADVNASNDFGSTALMWSVYDISRARMLLDHHADVNAATKAKETALLIAAAGADGEAVVRLLLSRGAAAGAVDGNSRNAFLAAALADNSGLVRLFLDRGADVNSADKAGDTALMGAAANGNAELTELLLQRGARVNVVSAAPAERVKNGIVNLGNFTPLLLAATYGPAKVVRLLLDAGADIHARDSRGATPLILSVTSQYQDPETVHLLLARGADPSLKMQTGETARDWAVKFRHPGVVALLGGGGAPPTIPVVFHEARDARAAAAAGLSIMEKTSSSFFQTGGCISCHAQNVTAMAAGAARANGIPSDEAAAGERLRVLNALWSGQMDRLLQRLDPPGAIDTIESSLVHFMAAGVPPGDVTSAMVHNIAVQQNANGSWRFSFNGIARAPIADSDISRTAIAVRVLDVLGPAGRKREFARRIERAREWLTKVKPRYIDDVDYQLLGLKWSGADGPLLRKLGRQLAAEQHPDGGWAQSRYLPSDVYATGQALYALHEGAGLPANDPVYARGVQFLLKTQAPDGSWFVRSRAVKFQPYFESGFPHGQDQWISQMATGWATLALTFAVPKPTIAMQAR
jgi:ankyrin repeat protein